MTLKDKAKTYNFWISLVSAIVLIVRIIGDKFNFFVDTNLIMDVTTGLCSIFVILGILSAPKIKNAKTSNNTNDIIEEKVEQSNAENKIINVVDTNNRETQESEVFDVTTTETSDQPKEIVAEVSNHDSFLESTDMNSDIIIPSVVPNDNVDDKQHIQEPIDEYVISPEITLDKLIENLRADIHKANMMVEKLTKELQQ